MIDPVDTPTSTGTVTDSSDPQNVSNTPTGSKGPSVVAPASSLEARPAHGRRRGQEQSCSAPGSATEANTGGWELSMIKDVHTCHELDPNTILFDRKALKLKPQVQRVVRKCARAGINFHGTQNLLQDEFPDEKIENRTLTNCLYKHRLEPKGIITEDAEDLCHWLREQQQMDGTVLFT
ncbi:hypothetical protein BGX31_005859 [Mortierella sp. GBA43]|nr:hypothetical protein BGX31_005859 [Mortierella sp. GBA43]